MNNFFTKHLAVTIALVAVLAGGGAALATYYFFRPVLPGLRYELSARSGQELRTLLSENPTAVAGFVIKYKFKAGENPIIWHWATPTQAAKVDQLMVSVDTAIKKEGKSSDDYEAETLKDPVRHEKMIRNSELAKSGVIVCGPLESDAIAQNPILTEFSKGLCYVTIPPYDKDTYLALIVLTNVPADINSPEILELRRVLLQLQLDVFNRDFKGTETWPRP